MAAHAGRKYLSCFMTIEPSRMLPVVGRLTAPRDVHIFSVCGRKDTADVIKDLEVGSLL